MIRSSIVALGQVILRISMCDESGSGGSGGGGSSRDAVFGKMLQNNRLAHPLGSWHTPREILDPPLSGVHSSVLGAWIREAQGMISTIDTLMSIRVLSELIYKLKLCDSNSNSQPGFWIPGKPSLLRSRYFRFSDIIYTVPKRRYRNVWNAHKSCAV